MGYYVSPISSNGDRARKINFFPKICCIKKSDGDSCIADNIVLVGGRHFSSCRCRLPGSEFLVTYFPSPLHDLRAEPRELVLEPVGPHFLAHARRKRHNRTFSEDEKHQAEVHALSLEDKSGNVSEDDEPEDPAMLQRDPKEWKVSTYG